jgi:hypothetical protein
MASRNDNQMVLTDNSCRMDPSSLSSPSLFRALCLMIFCHAGRSLENFSPGVGGWLLRWRLGAPIAYLGGESGDRSFQHGKAGVYDHYIDFE